VITTLGAKFALGDDFLTKYWPTLLQATGEQGGTEVMTAFNNLIGGHMQHSELKKLAADGFVDSKDLDYTKTGEIKGTKPGAKMFEESLFEKNPFQWANDFHDTYMKRKGSTDESFDKLVMSMPRNMGALIEEFVHNRQRYERDAANQGQAGMAASTNEWLGQNPAAGAEALKTSFEALATSITAPGVQALGPALAAAAQGVQTFAADIGGANQNLVALGGAAAVLAAGYGSMKALFGLGGFGLGKSALALDGSAEALTSAAIALGGHAGGVGGHGPGRSPSGMGWRAGSAAIGGATLLAGAPSSDDEINEALNDNSKSVVGQAVAASVDALKQLTDDALNYARGFEIRRPAPPAHAGGIGSDAVAAPMVNTSEIDRAKAKLDSLSMSPSVDVSVHTGQIDDAIGKARQLEDSLRRIGQMSFGPGATVGGMGPSLSSKLRGNFTSSTISGE
jgi:hypothetical protein